ncbi:hypothetical protein VPHD479_0291 [Vibrio phage D479]
MFLIRAKSHYVQFVLDSVGVNGFPQYKMMYTFNVVIATKFATREVAEQYIEEWEPDEKALWRVEPLGASLAKI